MKIAVVNHRLSDRSKVHDLVIRGDDGAELRLHCIDEACAIVLADMLCDAVNDWTTETAERAW
jgi:hypothetical protein